MSHISFARLLTLVVLGAGGAFAAAFAAYLNAHPLPADATAGALLANVNAAAFDSAQKAIAAGALALVAGLTRTDVGTPANGLRPADAPIAQGQELPTTIDELAAALAKRIGGGQP